MVEAAGTESALVLAIDHARPGGTVSLPGVYWDGLALPNVMTMFLKEVRLVPGKSGIAFVEFETEVQSGVAMGGRV